MNRSIGIRTRPWLVLALLACLEVACQGRPSGGASGSAPAGDHPAETQPRIVVLATVEGLGRGVLDGPSAASAPKLATACRSGSAAAPFFTPIPVTPSAIVSLMSGTAPQRLGIYGDLEARVPDGATTLAESFSRAGWSTCAVLGSPRLSRSMGLGRGFELFDAGTGSAMIAFRHYPQIRSADQVVADAIRWIDSLPAERRGFLWVHLSDLTAAYDPRRAGLAEQQGARLAALEGAIDRLRAALSDPKRGRGLLVVAGDRGQVLGTTADLGAGFFLEPDAIEVCLAVEGFGGQGAAIGSSRPDALQDLAVHVRRLAGLDATTAPEAERTAANRVVSISAVPWESCRWSPAVALATDGDLWVLDGAWTRYGKDRRPVVVAADEVPAGVRSQADDLARTMLAPLPSGPRSRKAEAALVAAGFSPPARESPPVRVPPDERRRIVESLQGARAAEVLGKGPVAASAYRALSVADSPLLAALEALVFRQSSLPNRAPLAWTNARKLVERYGADRTTLHAVAHAALANKKPQLAGALLDAYLERGPEEADVLYDLACVRSLEGDLDGAADYLSRSLEAGFSALDWIDQDADLRPLRADARFAAIMKKHGR